MAQTPRTIGAITAYQAAERGDHVAIICSGREVTYERLHRESNKTANALRAAGLSRGARVAYLGRESEHYYDIAFGCAKSETVLVPVNWRLTPAEVAHILRDSGTELLFVEREFTGVLAEVRADLPALRVVVDMDTGTDTEDERFAGFLAWKAGEPETCQEAATGPGDAFAQVYTSGTTGLPKGVVLPHRSFFTLRDTLVEHGLDWLDWRPEDVSLIGLPGLNTAGLSWAMQGFAGGVTNVAMPMFVSGEAVELIRDLGVTITFVAPAMLAMMLAEQAATKEAFATMRKVIYGASPITESLLLRCFETIDADFVQAYSATEAGNVVTVLPAPDHVPGSRLLASAGLACPGVELRITDNDGNPLPAGETGQVWVRTEAIMLGYWNRPDATEKALVDGWLRMGDTGYVDENGYLFLHDRIDDTIIVAGQNVYPTEIEKALGDHPAVADVAVIGIPHERWGEAVQACVVVRPGHTVRPRDLMLSLRGRLADYKIPTRYEFVDTIPRNPTGKIVRRHLRERFEVPA